MAAYPGEFDDFADDEFNAPLPPEDRLWRHPSELGSGSGGLPLDEVAVRRRWLTQQPSRASAWTAGLVGAILATGLVALGTHLAGAFTGHFTPAHDLATPLSASTPGVSPSALGIGTALDANIARVGASIATIEVLRGHSEQRCLGLVVRSDGMVVAPAPALAGATGLLVKTPDTVPAMAQLVALDRASGIAVLHVNGMSGLPAIQLNSNGASGALDPQSVALAVTAMGGSHYSLGSLEGLDATVALRGGELADALRTDIPAIDAVPGSPLIDANGTVVGMVAGAQGGSAVAVPAWIAGPVVHQLLTSGTVHHGKLGVIGETVPQANFQPAGVLLKTVAPGSAAGVAGLRAGDIITSVNFQRVTSVIGLRGHLYGLAGGQPVLLGISRGTTDLFYRIYLHGPSGG